MDSFPRLGKTSLVIGLLFLGPLLSTADFALADDPVIAYRQKSGQLLAVGESDGQNRSLGDLPLYFSDFDFDSQDRLWGISRGVLYRLGTPAPTLKRIAYLGHEPINYMAISPDGEVWATGKNLLDPTSENRLIRADLETGEVLATTELDVFLSGLAFVDDRLITLADQNLYEIDKDTFELTPFGQPISQGYHSIAGADGRLFALIAGVVSTMPMYLVEILPETGEVRTLQFLHEQSGSGLAVRVSSCFPSDDHLCLGERQRFQVSVDWQDPNGGSGQGRPVEVGSPDSGMFSFFGEDNWEVLVKVLSGCSTNNHHWVIASASTDVAFTLRVLDTHSGEERLYTNPLGMPAGAILDTEAFEACP